MHTLEDLRKITRIKIASDAANLVEGRLITKEGKSLLTDNDWTEIFDGVISVLSKYKT